MMNKNAFENRLAVLANLPVNPIIPCTKLPISNLVLPQNPVLLNIMHAFAPKTAEQPLGCKYDAKKYQSMVRVINGQLLFDDARRVDDNGVRTDNYCWTIDKVQGYVNKGKAKVINNKTEEGLANKEIFLQSLTSEKERQMMADMLNFLNADFLLIEDAMDKRFCIRITQELYNAGWTHCVDEWMDTDENGNAPATELFVGDVIIVNRQPNGKVTGYRVDKDIFAATYAI